MHSYALDKFIRILPTETPLFSPLAKVDVIWIEYVESCELF